MGPKLQKPSSRTVRARGAAGFRSNEEKLWFEKHFASRPLVIERPLARQAESPTPFFFSVIEARNWVRPLQKLRDCNVSIVREFCATLVQDDSNPWLYEAYVRGRAVILTPERLAHLLGIDELADYDCPFHPDRPSPPITHMASTLTGVPNSTWERNRIKTSSLTPDFRMLFLLVVNCIIPTTYTADFDLDVAKIVFAIGAGLRVSLAHLLIETIVHPCNFSAQNKSLKCGGIITELCRASGVTEKSGDEIRPPRGVFGESTNKRSTGQLAAIQKRAKIPLNVPEVESEDEESDPIPMDLGDEESEEESDEESEEEEEDVVRQVPIDYSRPENRERRSKRAEERPSVHGPLRDLLGQVLEGQHATNLRLARLEIDQQATGSHILDIQRHLARMGLAPPTRRRST